jgi:hypothetical protein
LLGNDEADVYATRTPSVNVPAATVHVVDVLKGIGVLVSAVPLTDAVPPACTGDVNSPDRMLR